MTHLYRAPYQPATRYHIALDGTRGVTIRHHSRAQIRADCCKERRYARNLRVQVYYDCLRFWCRQGKGCKASSAA